MTQTDCLVSSRPHTAAAATYDPELHGGRRAPAPAHRAPAHRGGIARRGLLAVPAVLALAIPASPALAQSSKGTSSTATSGYGQTAPVKTTTEPKSGTAPSKEATTPEAKSAPKPETTTTTPTTPAKTSVSPSESKLPFTGLDLRWIIGGGLLLLAAGISLRVTQRRSSGH